MFLTRQFWIIILWCYEPCRYFTARKIVESELSWCWQQFMLWSVRCLLVFDKLEAVPILCVERLVLPLFCMNASQSAKIFLWRSVPVWLCPCWMMTVFIRQGYLQYVMLWCDKNKVHGFFVFLFCCSFESYRLLWLVQPVGALLDYPLVLSLRRDLCW